MPLPNIVAHGVLGADPELKYASNGNAYTRLRLACTERKKGQDGQWYDAGTTWLDVTIFGYQAEPAAQELAKGSRVLVTGRLEQREHNSKTYYGLRADHIARDLQPKPAERTQAGQTPSEAWGAQPTPPSDPWATPSTTNDQPPF